jgi:hypothetical protein
MKTSFALWAIALALALFTNIGRSALINTNQPAPVNPPPPIVDADWWTRVSVSPYGAVKHPDFGKAVWGAGLDLGYAINRTVSLHLANSIFDQPDIRTHEGTQERGWWKGSAIDETELLFRADLIKGGGTGHDRFVGYLIGGGSRDWEREDWGFGVGVGAEIRLTKNFSIGADCRLRAWFDAEKDAMTRGLISFKF